MRLLLPILVAFTTLAALPAAAQLHERGIAREGAVQRSTPGGNAFMCRMACTIEAGCAGWNWVRAGEDGPESRCQLLAGVTASQPDSCCDSGVNGSPRAAGVTQAPPPQGNQYSNRSTTPTGPPVQLVGDPTGGIWREPGLEGGDEDAGDEADDGEEAIYAEDEDSARIENMARSEAPEVTAPSARITSAGQPRSGGAPRYSVQREYQTAPQPAAPAPEGMANPSRWIDGAATISRAAL